MMWDRKEIKEQGKIAFKANYWKSVLTALIVTLIAGGSAAANGARSAGQDSDDETNQAFNDAQEAYNSLPEDQKNTINLIIAAAVVAGMFLLGVYILLKIFVLNPLQVGCYRFFRENAVTPDADLNTLKVGFDNYWRSVLSMFLRDLFTGLWFCLFIIPGCIKIYSYRMVPFILKDRPELSAREAINESRSLMNGHKWNVFVFDLSYIGWYLVGMVTFGLVNVFWTEPYRQNANAKLYLSLIGENPDENVFMPEAAYAPQPEALEHPDQPEALAEPEAPAEPPAPEEPDAPVEPPAPDAGEESVE